MQKRLKTPARRDYQKVTGAFRKLRGGATVADIVAKTALPIATVRELVPLAADEYSARLEVTESGEIRYSFPRGFTSKYRGIRARLRKAAEGLRRGVKTGGAWIFKVWIMVMLMGYFALFMVLALASLMLSIAASQSNSNNRSSNRGGDGMFMISGIFNMIIRIWFYSELFKAADPYYGPSRRAARRPKKSPLHRAIFSFVFGDGDPNAGWSVREKQGVIAYIQANRGVISLGELMFLTGLPPAEAEGRISAYCVEFGGSPEATEDGTVVYRFDELLLQANTKDRVSGGYAAPLKRLKPFSGNTAKMNRWFCVINAVNTLFGGYYLFNALASGAVLTQAQLQASSFLYGITYALCSSLVANPFPFIVFGLGLTPLIFSLLFWLIPGLRSLKTAKDNEGIKLENYRKDLFSRIWQNPLQVNPGTLGPQNAECRPQNLAAAQDRLIKELGAYTMPEASVDSQGAVIYSFQELKREQEALNRYRASIDPAASNLGKTVFDTESTTPS
ncbi:MAG: hypothetical protein LBD37_07515 [Treponema sp.]|jgi:hypothetical protein|nr:hypothetical protein [Treponema sp.]